MNPARLSAYLTLTLSLPVRVVAPEFALQTLGEIEDHDEMYESRLDDVYDFAGHCRVLFSFGSRGGGLHLSMRLKEVIEQALGWDGKSVYIDAVS